MSEVVLIVAVLAALAAIVAAVVVAVRSARQERMVRDDLSRLQVTLAQSQRDTFEQVSQQLTEVVGSFHSRLGEFGQQVQGGQASTGETLRQGLEEARRTLQSQLEGLVTTVNTQLGASQQQFGVQFEGATKVFGELKGQLGRVAEMATRMEALGHEIDELQGVLKAPKLRGNFGEAGLEEFLRQVLPPTAWEAPYAFSDGKAVDAVIKLSGHLVPVDAKFPLESFRRMLGTDDDALRKTARKEFDRSVRARVEEIASKYIRPGERTFEFALMYIPAEAVYYEVIIRDESLGEGESLLAYALANRVVPVSPNSFYAYLATIATGLKGMQVEARAREIQAELGRLQTDFEQLAKALETLGKHLHNAGEQYQRAEKLTGRIDDHLKSLTSGDRAALEAGEVEVSLPDES